MKTIDTKSLLIGGLLASTILLGIAAVPSDTSTPGHSKWDDKQRWWVKREIFRGGVWAVEDGYQPFAATDSFVHYRKRIK